MMVAHNQWGKSERIKVCRPESITKGYEHSSAPRLHFAEIEKKITVGMYVFSGKTISGNKVYPDVRVISQGDEEKLNALKAQIEGLQKQRDDFMRDQFLTWRFLTADEAKEIIEENIRNRKQEAGL